MAHVFRIGCRLSRSGNEISSISSLPASIFEKSRMSLLMESKGRTDFVTHRRQERALCLAGSLWGAFGVLQMLLELLPFRNVFRGDNDSPDLPMRIIPGINGGTHPLLCAIGSNPDVLAQMLLLTRHSPAMRFPPFFGQIGDQFVKAKSAQVGMPKTVVCGKRLSAVRSES
jgi:hypothetical protein